MLRKSCLCLLIINILLFSAHSVLSNAHPYQINKSVIKWSENNIYAEGSESHQSFPEVELRAYNVDRKGETNTISPWFRIYNTGTSEINLSDMEIRYYFTREGEEDYKFLCDWSNIGSSNISGTFIEMPAPMIGADCYLGIKFENGAESIKPGEYVEIQSRFAKSDWSKNNQLNDYSFNKESDSFIDWQKVTVYANGTLIWGVEPNEPEPVPVPVKELEIRMCNAQVNQKTNTLFPRYVLLNTGNVSINLNDVRIRYYYTIDGEEEQNFWCDWSSVGASNITGKFVKLDEPVEKADYYVEVGFKPGAGILKPGSQVEIHTRIAKTNWKDYDQFNDYSYSASQHNYILWNKVTVFIGNEMIWGDQTLLGKPVILSAEAQENSVRLIWTPVEGATDYDIEDCGTVVGSVYYNAFNHIELSPGTFHQYRVRAVSSALTGSWSDIFEIWTLPDIPGGIVAEATENLINIAWEPVPGATGYDIEIDGNFFEGVESPFIYANLQPGTMHQYRIRAKNSSGYGKWTEVTDKWTIPDKVSGVNAYATQTVVVVYWDDAAGANAYDIEFDGRLLEVPVPAVSVTDLKPGTLHRYRIRARNDSGAGAWSEEYTYWTIPGIAENVISSATETQIEIAWEDVPGATGYDIEVDGELIENRFSPYTYGNLDSGTRHVFKIRAKNSSGIGYWNEAMEVWTLPGSVEGIEVQGLHNKIIIQWEPVRGATGYEIKHDDIVFETSTSPFIHEGLDPGTLHKYVIRAKNTSGAGRWSDEAICWTLPGTVKITNLEAAETEIKIFWEDAAGADGYDIEVDGVVFEDVSSPYLHRGLLEGTEHTYRLRAKNSSGCGLWSDEIVKWTIPAIPGNVAVLSGETYLVASWNDVAGATGYDIKINETLLEDVTNPCTKKDLSPGTKYILMVRAKNGSGAGKWSEPAEAWTIPGTVEKIEFQASQTFFQVQWDNVEGADGYDIEVDGQIQTNVESPFICRDIQPGTEHTVRIRARNSGGVGRWCDAYTIWTLPDIPQNIITQPSSNAIKIMWDPVTGATGYDIEIYGAVVDVGAQEWYIHEGINPNNQQTYRIRAKNSSGEGDWSSYTAETTLPGIPSYIRTEAGDKQIDIYWDAIPGALTYDLEADGIIIYGLPEPEFEHKDLQPDTVHSYRVRSNGYKGSSEWSEAVECSTLLSSPENIEAALSAEQIKLSWDAVNGASGYDVEVDGQVYDNGSSVVFMHTGLTPNSRHTYRVRAKNSRTEGVWSQPLTKSTLLGAPQNIRGEASGTHIIVRWDMVEGALSYDIEADGQIFSNGLSTQFIHTDLQPLSVHTYRVRTSNREGAGEWSEPAEFHTLVGTPSSFDISSTSSEIKVQWDEVPGAAGYDIMVDGNIYDNGDKTSYTHTGIEPDSLHIYRVRAKSEFNTGQWSEMVSARTLVGIPTNLDIKPLSRQIRIAWDEVKGASHYDIEINGEVAATVTECCHNQTGLSPNSAYRIRIRAKNELGNGGWSNYIESMTSPDIPADLSAQETTSEIILNWNAVEGAISYDLEVDGVVINDISGTNYVHSALRPNTRHIYRIRSKNEYAASEWSEFLTRLTTPEVAVPTQKDVIFNFVIVAPQKAGINERTIIVNYDPEELEVFDLCALTPQPETETGVIEGTNICIVEFNPGRIVCKITNANKTVFQIIKFLSNKNGHSNVTYTIH